MAILQELRDNFVNFLFPKKNSVLELESLSKSALLETLPHADVLKDANTYALFDYKHPLVKEVVWQVKYSGNARLAEKLGEILFETISRECRETSPTLLIPIPISDKRRFERGWNQSELLCEKIKLFDKENIFNYLPRELAKVVHTESQTKTSSKSERIKNLNNSMKVLSTGIVRDRNVVLIDDVITTGSTFHEAKRALREAGAKKIICVAIAH